MNESRWVLTSDGDASSERLPGRTSRVQRSQSGGEADAEQLVELMRRCSCRQEDALAELYDLTSAGIYGIVLCVVRSTDLAATITQDVYVEVWRRSARYVPGNGSVLRWVMTMAHRMAVDGVRLVAS